jgi:hypothetical protein
VHGWDGNGVRPAVHKEDWSNERRCKVRGFR